MYGTLAMCYHRPLGHLSRRKKNVLGQKDSNLRMAGSKPAALPLGDAPFDDFFVRS